MQLDDMKAAWATQGAQIDRLLDVNEQLLRDVTMRKVRSSLIPYLLWRAVEVAVGAAMTVLSGMVLSRHIEDVLYVTIVGAMFLFAVFMTATTLRLMVRALYLDHGEQVSDMQHAVAKLKLAEFHTLKWALLGGVVLWLPAILVLIEALVGADVLSQVPLAWLLANVAFGLAVLVLGQYLAKKYVDTKERAPWQQRFLDYASGRQLTAIGRHIDELSAFSREPASSS